MSSNNNNINQAIINQGHPDIIPPDLTNNNDANIF